MKNFIIERRVNPFDKWEKYKQFDILTTAQQSFEMLKKHTYNPSKNTDYMKYRLYDVKNDVYYQ